MKKEDYSKSKNELLKELEVDTTKKHYISVKDKSVFYRPEKTSQDTLNDNKQKTLTDWDKKGYVKYDGELKDLPQGQYIRFIKKDGTLLNGGYMVSNKKDEKYFYLRGVNFKGFPVQYEDIDKVYHNKEQHSKALEKQKASQDKKEAKEQQKKSKPDKKKDEPEPEPEPPKEIKPEKPKKLTDDEKNAILNDYYYDKGFTYGRDRLHNKIVNDGHSITRAFVDKWLKQQVLYDLIIPSKTNVPNIKLAQPIKKITKLSRQNKKTKKIVSKLYRITFNNDKVVDVDEKVFKILLKDQQVKDIYEDKYLKK
jgi:hypothetical protein